MEFKSTYQNLTQLTVYIIVFAAVVQFSGLLGVAGQLFDSSMLEKIERISSVELDGSDIEDASEKNDQTYYWNEHLHNRPFNLSQSSLFVIGGIFKERYSEILCPPPESI